MLNLFVLDAQSNEIIPTYVDTATEKDFNDTADWQTVWTTEAVAQMPNKVALHRTDNGELLGLMSYDADYKSLAVEIIYIESAKHSNANMLRQVGKQKKYVGVAKALFAYAVEVSIQAGFEGVVFFKAKTTELLEYYMKEFEAKQIGSYDPFRLVLWEDAAEKVISEFKDGDLDG